ncbi:YbaB/EbfC family nucleoid-associated protein [Nocardia sp. NBC_01730]|uniref:YbaB/EbfC family nucleoid-associated protein n=1 Tax=Nocardia sp. NBC_01730 TaxID=2975998 RepID=UPI002E131BEC|nr:YbaB/EbfC family nucleoid-associated protein [Nocardia sp. NBC_01730]
MIENTDELAARVKRINEATERVRGRAQSTDSTVYIETDARGAITDLQLSPYAQEHDPDRLAALITDRHRVAHANAEAEAERVFTELSSEYQPSTFAPASRHDERGPGHGGFGDHGYVI